MAKIIITESQTQKLISELFSQKLVNNLIDKFKEQTPNLDDKTASFYIDRFQQIKDSPKIQNKDITTYSWKELQEVVDYNQPDDIKIEGDEELIYNQNNLKIYRTNSKQACVKYGTGYNFCISSRGNNNEYYYYRYNQRPNTIYFVIDEGRTKKQNDDKTFVDPKHLIVIMVTEKYVNFKGRTLVSLSYQVTNANNDGETKYDSIYDITEKLQPKLRGLEKLFKAVNPHPKEKKYKNLLDYYSLRFDDLIFGDESPDNENSKFNPEIGAIQFPFEKLYYNKDYQVLLLNYLNGKPGYIYNTSINSPWVDPIVVSPTKINPIKYLNHLKNDFHLDASDNDINVNINLPDDPKYVEYLKKVKNLFDEFLHEKNKLNMK